MFSISLISAVGIYLDKGNKVKDSTQNSSKELVTWGSNLASGVSNKRMTSELSKMYDNIPYPVISIIHGLLLSDAWLTFSSKASKNARLGFSQSLAKFAYLWSVFNSLSPYCGSYPMLRIRTRKGSKNVSLEFFTRSLPFFTNLYSEYYVSLPKGIVKSIPKNLFNILDPIALAHWICGDGSPRVSGGLVLCTDSYTLQEVVRLISVLIYRYQLECSVHTSNPGQYRIYIHKASMNSLRNIVSQHMVPSMLYKLHL